MTGARAEARPDRAMRHAFPGLYVTLVSIVVALAIEGVVTRLSDLLPALSFDLRTLVIALQVFFVVWLASLMWWVSSRWITTIPWPFSIFDGLSLMLLLLAFHLTTEAIGVSFARWCLYTGVFGLAISYTYRTNGRRGLGYTGRSSGVADAHRVPTALVAATGAPLLLIGILTERAELRLGWQLAVVLATLLLTVVFARSDYTVWRRAAEEPSVFEADEEASERSATGGEREPR